MFGLWGLSRSYGGGYYDDYGPDRSQWRTKSDAALRRENQAKALFDTFLNESSKASSTAFPVTKEVVPPQVHLTDACWKSFKQYVVAAGCTTKRREATHAERVASKDTRKSKMYVISITIPVHPDQVKEALRQKQEKAAAEKEARKKKQAEKEAKEKALQAKIKEEYQAVVDSLTGSNNNTEKAVADSTTDGSSKEPADDESGSNNNNTTDSEPLAATKKRKVSASPTAPPAAKKIRVTAPRNRMMQYAELVHQTRIRAVERDIYDEQQRERSRILQELDDRMRAKKEGLVQEARVYCDTVKAAIGELCGGASTTAAGSVGQK